jgi:GAF domain-containing protein
MPTVSSTSSPRAPVRSRGVRPRHRAHERFVVSGETPRGVRSVIADSWRRCRSAGVDAELAAAPVRLVDADLRAHRDEHPLAPVVPVVRMLLGQIATDASHLIAVGDADGTLLWVEGDRTLRGKAERINFVEGALWAERRAGTNAPGTALATGAPAQVVAAEHFSRIVHPWTCSAAPVHDPFSRELLGVIDVTGGDHLATPVSLSLVHATALAVEGELTRLHAARAAGARVDEPGPARLEVMGRDEATLVLGSDKRRLSRRHSEILALLVDRPAGLSGEQLGIELYGDDANPITLRAEMVRLRKLLGPDRLGSRPYRLLVPLVADFTDVQRLMERGSVEAALRHYRGPLLPASEAPGIERIRWVLEQQARAALLATTDPAPLLHWTSTPWGREDLELWEHLATTAPDGAARQLARTQACRLAAEFAVPLALPAPRARATSLQPRRR